VRARERRSKGQSEAESRIEREREEREREERGRAVSCMCVCVCMCVCEEHGHKSLNIYTLCTPRTSKSTLIPPPPPSPSRSPPIWFALSMCELFFLPLGRAHSLARVMTRCCFSTAPQLLRGALVIAAITSLSRSVSL